MIIAISINIVLFFRKFESEVIMKTNLFFTLWTIFACLVFSMSSCSEVGTPNGYTENSLSAEESKMSDTFLGKWMVSEGEYESFEFLKDGTYIIVKRQKNAANSGMLFRDAGNSAIYIGVWTVVGDKIILENFGEISQIEVSGADLRLGFTINGEAVTGEAAKTITDTDAAKLSKIWNSYTITTSASCTGEDLTSSTGKGNGYTMVFTQAGTYLMLYTNDPQEIASTGQLNVKVANWVWATQGSKIKYTWANGVEGFIDVLWLNKDLVIKEGNLHFCFNQMPAINGFDPNGLDVVPSVKTVDMVYGAGKKSFPEGEYIINCSTQPWAPDGQGQFVCTGQGNIIFGGNEQNINGQSGMGVCKIGTSFKVLSGDNIQCEQTW